MIVIDSSVIIDSLLPKLGDRYLKADKILKEVKQKDLRVYTPKILKVELASVLSRKKDVDIVRRFIEELVSEIALIPEERLFDLAYDIAFKVRGRATDAYFIATAKLTNSLLITNDKKNYGKQRKKVWN
ncbi:MAG: PIN domain-containing protein [Archaeoglobales archaeon]|nr:MAG: PIN domain-containing protein [Archaeoglobales archaeon]